MYKAVIFALACACASKTSLVKASNDIQRSGADECQVTPVIHVLQYPGCVPKPIPSFACIGRCASYLQVCCSFFYSLKSFFL